MPWVEHTFQEKPLFADVVKPNARVRHRVGLYLLDWFFMVSAALIGGALFAFVPVRQHLFRLDDPDISYPVKPDIVPFWLLIVLSFVVPAICMSVVAIFFVRSLHDLHHAILGLFQSIAVALLLVSIVKVFMGGLRPHFLARCRPDLSLITNATMHGYDNRYYDTSICTNSQYDINDAQSSFPSGHSGIAAAGLIYFSLYLNGKFKTYNHRGHMWIYALVTASSFGSTLIAFSRVVDYHHTFGNIIMGYLIGAIVAFSMYRLNYMSVFGRYNHVPVADYWYHRHKYDGEQLNVIVNQQTLAETERNKLENKNLVTPSHAPAATAPSPSPPSPVPSLATLHPFPPANPNAVPDYVVVPLGPSTR